MPSNHSFDKGSCVNALERGLSYLSSTTGADGLIPNHAPSDPPGIWTTSEVFTVLRELCIPVDTFWLSNMAKSIIQAQREDGGWPIVQFTQSTIPSTAGGIIAASSIFDFAEQQADGRLAELSQLASLKAVEWLIGLQNNDGGWRYGSTAISKSNLSSTAFAVRALGSFIDQPFSQPDKKNRVLQALIKGIHFLRDRQNEDGGWGEQPSSPSNIASSSLVIQALNYRVGSDGKESVDKGLRYVARTHLNSPAMRVFAETFDPRSPVTTVNHNTPFDLFNLLLTFQVADGKVEHLLSWFVDTQESDGSWQLRCIVTDRVWPISTWVTAEAMHLVNRRLCGSERLT